MKLFYSYSHLDSDLKEILETHLAVLKRQNIISTWSDRKISAGQDGGEEINKNLFESEIVLLLISSFFIASDYCYEQEMEYAIKEHNIGRKLVIPIFLRPCLWNDTPFSKIQGLPTDARFVTNFSDIHEAFANIAEGIKNAILRFKPVVVSSNSFDTKTDIITNYLKKIHQIYSDFFNNKAYIELRTINDKLGHHVFLDKELLNWVLKREYPLFLVGDFGSGKTWALMRLIYNLANYDSNIIPIFIKIPTIVNIDENIVIHFENIEIINFIMNNLTYKALFLLDGLDELAFNKAYNIHDVIDKIFKKLPQNSKVVISCRKQTYNSLEKLEIISLPSNIDSFDNETEWAINKIVCHPHFLFIDNLKQENIEYFFNNSDIKENWRSYKYKKQIFDLVKQPVLLRLFEMLLNEYKDDVSINTIYEIYEKALTVWLYRDKCLNITSQKKVRDWLMFCEEIFSQMFPYNYFLLNDDTKIESRDKLNGLLHIDIFNLINKNIITFSHQSLYEYFYSRKLLSELLDYNSRLLAKSNLIYIYQVNRFIVPQLVRLTKNSENPQKRITSFIKEDEYNQFVEDSNWRKEKVYGQWLHFNSPDGTFPTSDREMIYSLDTNPKVHTDSEHKIISGISWYDAIQYCRWHNARLLTWNEAIENKSDHSELMEWTSDWYDEKKSQIAVIQGGKAIGLNPDLRDKNLSFRIMK